MENQPLIAVRIKDGIFIGNVTAAHDEDFLLMNKVTHIVNCAGAEVRDLYENIGIQYLTFPWKDSANGTVCSTVMFDSADRNIENALRFIDKGLSGGECVLIHSFFGVSRSCALAAAYLVVKYGWTLDNTLRFMEMAHQDMSIKPYFMRQLRGFAKRHEVQIDIFDPRVDEGGFALDNDQWMLRNTFVNGLVSDVQDKHELYKTAAAQIRICDPNYKNSAKRRRRIIFCDTKQGTSVHSTVTQPLAQGSGKVSQYVDPATGQACVISRAAPNSELRPIIARRGTPNSHSLESPQDVNARGRQVLVLRQTGYGRTTMGVGLPEAPRSTTPTPIARTDYQSASQATLAQPQQYQQSNPQRGAQPTSGGTQQQQQTFAASPNTIMRQPQPRVSPAAVPPNSSSFSQVQQLPSQQQPQQQTQQQPTLATTSSRPATTAPPRRGLVTSPFTLTSASQQRRGSPLPLNRQASGRPQQAAPVQPLAVASAYRASPTRQAPPVAVPTHPAISERGRNSSPLQRTASGGGGAPTVAPRTNSPLGRVQQDPATYHTLTAPQGSSANRASPTSHYIFQSVPHASATVTAGNPMATGGMIMRGNPNAPIAPGVRTGSPLGRRAQPTYAPQAQMTASTPTYGGSPMRPGSAPQQQPQPYQAQAQPRGSSPQGRNAGGSPMRNSLAEQYLSGNAGGAGGERGNARYARDTTSSYLRKPR